MQRIAFITSRRAVVRGRPSRRGGGMKGATRAHSRSVMSCVDAPSDASGFLATVEHVVRSGRVSGLEDAALVAVRACMEICRSGPFRLRALGGARRGSLVRPIRSRDRLPLRCLRPRSHPRRQLRLRMNNRGHPEEARRGWKEPCEISGDCPNDPLASSAVSARDGCRSCPWRYPKARRYPSM